MSDQAPSTITLSPEDLAAPWREDLARRAAQALATTLERLGLSHPADPSISADPATSGNPLFAEGPAALLGGPVRVTTRDSERAFHAYLGSRPTHVVAVARPATREVVILRPAFFSSTVPAQQRILEHEMTHLVIGRLAERELPAWLDEGLAMIVAGDAPLGGGWRLAAAATFGKLLPLEQLERQVAVGGQLQELAYAQSLSLTRFFLERTFGEDDEAPTAAAPLARALAQPERARALLERLWDPNYRYALEQQWRRSVRGFDAWIAAISSAGVFWVLLGGLLVAAWWRKRRMNRLRREQMAADDERDRELGLETPPWEYEADEEDPDERP